MATTALGIVSRVNRSASAGARESWGRGAGVPEMDLIGRFRDRSRGSDSVALVARVLGAGGRVERVGDLFEEQALVLQRSEAAFA
jgi:hypothetical protein